jgi:hypothetical protein
MVVTMAPLNGRRIVLPEQIGARPHRAAAGGPGNRREDRRIEILE